MSASPAEWRRPLAAGLHLLAEALLWFMALRAFASAVERERFASLSEAISRALRAGDLAQPDRAADALALAEAAADAASGGPPLPVVAAMAFGAFGLMRLLASADLPLPARAAAGVAASIAGVAAGVQLALADGAPWEGGILAGIAGEVGAAEFVADPDVEGLRGVSRTVTVAGLTALWVRFLIAGRGPITFERTLRVFGVGFAVAILVTLFGRAAGVGGAGWLVMPYFVISALALATAHAARAPADDLAVRRDAPWAVSVFGTVGLLAALSLLFGLLMLVDAQRVFDPVGAAAGAALTWTLTVLLTPIAWAVEWLLGFVFGLIGAEEEFREFAAERGGGDVAAERGEREPLIRFPGWAPDAARGLAAGLALYLLYRVGLLLFRRRAGGREEQWAEQRAASRPVGLGALLRGVVPRPRSRRPASREWLARSRAYRLYARMADDAVARGAAPAAGQTPLEFGADAASRLDAPPFPAVAAAFDRARYGRREPPAADLDALERRLDEWERAHPLPEEA